VRRQADVADGLFQPSDSAIQFLQADLAKKYEGIDPDAVKTLLADKVRLEDEKLIKGGEVEKLVEKRTKGILSDMEKRLHAAEQSASSLSANCSKKKSSATSSRPQRSLACGLRRSDASDAICRVPPSW